MADPSPGAQRVRLDTLTAFRFFAALGVLAHHGVLQLVEMQPWVGVAGIGRYGVDFFFVLSGFVLTWSYRPGRTKARFYWLRFARVWPLHVATLVLAWLLIGGAPWSTVAANLALVQAWVPMSEVSGALNTPSWTLSVEAFFYLLFPFLIGPLRRLGGRGLALVCGGAWVFQAALPVLVHFVPSLWTMEVWFTVRLPAARLPEFLVGMCVAVLVQRGWRPGRVLVVVAGVALAAMVPAAILLSGLNDRLWLWQLWAMPWLGVVVAAGAARDLAGNQTPRALVRLGDWSYALYLVHYPVLQWLDLTLGFAGWGWLLAFSVGSLVLAGLAYTYWERPVERYLRGLGVERDVRAPEQRPR